MNPLSKIFRALRPAAVYLCFLLTHCPATGLHVLYIVPPLACTPHEYVQGRIQARLFTQQRAPPLPPLLL